MMDEGETHARVFPFVPSDPEPDYLPVVAFIVGFLATVFAGLWIFPIGEIMLLTYQGSIAIDESRAPIIEDRLPLSVGQPYAGARDPRIGTQSPLGIVARLHPQRVGIGGDENSSKRQYKSRGRHDPSRDEEEAQRLAHEAAVDRNKIEMQMGKLK